MKNIICLTGVSGVGKGYTAKKYCEQKCSTRHLVASDILKNELSQSKEQMRTSQKSKIESNQDVLVKAFHRILHGKSDNTEIIFDCHMLIDNDNGLVQVPLNIFQETNINQMVFVNDNPSVIYERRKNDVMRIRPERSIQDIERQQQKALDIANSYASALRIPFHVISPCPKELERIIRELAIV